MKRIRTQWSFAFPMERGRIEYSAASVASTSVGLKRHFGAMNDDENHRLNAKPSVAVSNVFLTVGNLLSLDNIPFNTRAVYASVTSMGLQI